MALSFCYSLNILACLSSGFHACSLSLPDPLCLTQYSKGTGSERPSQAGGNGMLYPHPHIFLSSASCSRHHQLTSYCLSGIVFISTPGELLAPFCPLLGPQHLELCLEYNVPNFLPCEECPGCDLAALMQTCLDGKGHHWRADFSPFLKIKELDTPTTSKECREFITPLGPLDALPPSHTLLLIHQICHSYSKAIA